MTKPLDTKEVVSIEEVLEEIKKMENKKPLCGVWFNHQSFSSHQFLEAKNKPL
jgi:hypothetical protein